MYTGKQIIKNQKTKFRKNIDEDKEFVIKGHQKQNKKIYKNFNFDNENESEEYYEFRRN